MKPKQNLDLRTLMYNISHYYKGVLGEDLFSKRFSTQKVEGRLKIMLYNKFISL